MNSDERLLELKKAYADIILNTAKEAAARIMLSERKALRFQYELWAAKEEALQMMVRLKTMMDSKISEAEMATLSQQRKAEELEAQLQEAEDIVKDLREELREVHAELERVTSNKVQHVVERDIATPEDVSEENGLYASQFTIYPPLKSRQEAPSASDPWNLSLTQRNEVRKCYNAVIHMENSFVGNPDLPSIILRSKEPELYRNGCTQRVRACEGNLLDGELSLSGHLNDPKHEIIVKRKRSPRYRKQRSLPCSYHPDGSMKRDRAPLFSCSSINPNSVKSNAQPEEGPSEWGERLSSEATGLSMQLPHAANIQNEEEFVKACGVQNPIYENEVLINEFGSKGQEDGFTENAGAPACNICPEKVEESVVSSESKASDTTNRLPSQPPKDRIIKYTFQRKRKRDSLSNFNGNASLEDVTLERKDGELQNDFLEPESNLINGSSRDSRRSAHVAHQVGDICRCCLLS
ncbi:hypothetical protein RJ639_036633 [Escallonia herrerae]|uniref:Uncharacterized protein n=1 Tax=Escallonia herrerae TaxID=1293975 RepID=A0AA89B9E3_9ASTE|nr:hypothetical protein RJ639_036633 [Escallonia herrerae]